MGNTIGCCSDKKDDHGHSHPHAKDHGHDAVKKADEKKTIMTKAELKQGMLKNLNQKLLDNGLSPADLPNHESHEQLAMEVKQQKHITA